MKSRETEYSWKEWVSITGALILGAVFFIASIGKVLDPVMFVEQIRKEGLEIIFSANTVALIALAIETFLGAALLLGVRTFWIVAPSTALSAFFVFLTGRSYWYVLTGARDNSYDCGCFGIFMQRTVEEAFWQDITLVLVPLVLIFFGSRYRSFEIPPVRILIALVCTAAVCLWAVAVEGMPPSVPEMDPEMSASASMAEQGLDLYQPSSQYGLLIEGQPEGEASVYESQETLRLLIVSPRFPHPMVLDIRSNRVYRVEPGAVRLGGEVENGAAVPLEIEFEEVGDFTINNDGLSFVIDGISCSLISK